MKKILFLFCLIALTNASVFAQETEQKAFLQTDIAVCGAKAEMPPVELYGAKNSEQRVRAEETLKARGCLLLPVNEPIVWDGKHGPGVMAQVEARGRKFKIPAHMLSYFKHQNLFNKDYVTSSASYLCAKAFDLKEASAAASDTNWLKSLNCMHPQSGLPIIRIRPDMQDLREPWQVRLRLPDGTGVTLWGYASAFTLPDGERVR